MALVFIASATASSSATLEFTSGIDSTYNEYQFQFVNMHPQTSSDFKFQVNSTDYPASGGGAYDVSLITSTHFRAYHRESNDETFLGYSDGHDLAQQAEHQIISNGVTNSNDNGCSGLLTLYAPSSTTYVKHFTARFQNTNGGDYSQQSFTAGYINDTTAIDEISFKFNSGNIDAGTIYMYGVG